MSDNKIFFNENAFNYFKNNDTDINLIIYNEIINKIYSSFYLYRIEFLVEKSIEPKEKLIDITKKYLHNFADSNIDNYKSKIESFKIDNHNYIFDTLIGESYFNISLFPFFQEKKCRYNITSLEDLFLEINNLYLSVWFDSSNIKELKKEWDKTRHNAYIFVFWDINHVNIKDFFRDYNNIDVINLDKIEVQNILSIFCNKILVSENKNLFNLNQFKVEFPFLYLWNHINIKDTLNNVKWIEIPSNIKSLISYSLLSSISINKTDENENKKYSLTISDKNYKDKIYLWWKLIDILPWIPDFINDIDWEHTVTDLPNLPIFINYESFKVFYSELNKKEEYVVNNWTNWELKYEDNKIKIDNEYYDIISINPRFIVNRTWWNKYILKVIWSTKSKIDFSKINRLDKFLDKKKDALKNGYKYELIKENELIIWTNEKTTALYDTDLYIITTKWNDYFIFNKQKFYWKGNWYILNQYKLLWFRFNISNWDNLNQYIEDFKEWKNFKYLFDALKLKNNRLINNKLKSKLNNPSTNLEDNISKTILKEIKSNNYFFWWKWWELADILWIISNSNEFTLELFHMKTYPFIKCYNPTIISSDHYWEYTEVLWQVVQKLKWFFDIKDNKTISIQPILDKIKEYYNSNTESNNKIKERLDKITKKENVVVKINIYIPIYMNDLLEYDNILKEYKVINVDKINWSSIYLLNNLIDSNISNINLTWLKVNWNIFGLLIDENLATIKKINLTELFK